MMKQSKRIHTVNPVFTVLLMLALLLPFNTTVQAQDDGGDGSDPTNAVVSTGNAAILVQSPSTERFPLVSFTMEAYDQTGRFITTLYPSAVEVIEDGQTMLSNEVTLIEPGLQFTIALNPGVMYLNTYLGYTNWDRIAYTIQTWAESLAPGIPDDLSFVAGEKILETHYTSPRAFSNLFDEYKPDFLTENPALYSLSTALQMASESTNNPLSKRSILWITPALNNTLNQLLPSMIDQAEALGVQVNVWMVGTAYTAESESAPIMKELAERTGGSFFIYTGLEFLPDIEEYIQPLRYYYNAAYYSQVTQAGDHEFLVNVYYESLELHSSKQNFSIILEPPNPIFLSPPTLTEQTWNIASNAIDPILTPDYVSFELLMEFPDGIPRQIITSRLFIDGEMVQENIQAPFDRFKWYIGDNTENRTVSVQAEIVDALGYTARTIELPLTLTMAEKPLAFFSNTRLVTGAAIGAAAVMLLAVIFFSGRHRSLLKQEEAERARNNADPLTQPVIIRQELLPRTSPIIQPSPSRKELFYQESKPARFIYLSELPATSNQKVIILSDKEITIGSDERYADILLQKPSIDPRHARVFRDQQGAFIIADCDSLAGTWLNYTPVSEGGAHLKDGDLVQLGQEVFRFEAAVFSVQNLPISLDS